MDRFLLLKINQEERPGLLRLTPNVTRSFKIPPITITPGIVPPRQCQACAQSSAW